MEDIYDVDDIYDVLDLPPVQRTRRVRANFQEDLSDLEFRQNFRFSKAGVNRLLDRLGDCDWAAVFSLFSGGWSRIYEVWDSNHSLTIKWSISWYLKKTFQHQVQTFNWLTLTSHLVYSVKTTHPPTTTKRAYQGQYDYHPYHHIFFHHYPNHHSHHHPF